MKLRAIVPALVLLAAAGCSSATPSTTVEPGDGPAADPASSYSGPVEGEPSTNDVPTEEPSDQTPTANFKEKLTYTDGVEIEVTRITTSKITAAQAETTLDEKAGTAYAVLTIRIRNGSKKTLDTLVSPTVTYGPDGEEAPKLYAIETATGDISGKLVPGKAKSSGFAYAIPTKYQDDVVMEVGPDLEHESAVFTGSLR